MSIEFAPLSKEDFMKLQQWLNTSHVNSWYGEYQNWTLETVANKYCSYCDGFKLESGEMKPIHAFIIHYDSKPIGYIQYYNAYDFPRDGYELNNLPKSLAAIDMFIGDEKYTGQGIGSKAIELFLNVYAFEDFDYAFVDPESSNLAAIKTYENAGFTKASKQEDAKEVWMIKDLSSRNDPLATIQKLIKERYPDAKAVFWAGSVAENQGTDSSDLDLVIVFESVPNAYREAFIYDGWPIDAFIHDLDTLRYFCGKLEASDGKPALINMILQGHEILAVNEQSNQGKAIAGEALAKGPNVWGQEQIDKERFLITDILDDIKSPKNKDEQIISAVHLFEPLLQFYFRCQKKWAASGKSLIRLFQAENPELAKEWVAAFENMVKTGDATAIETVVTKILEPHDSYLWDGFRSDAPAEWKTLDENKILEELKSREPIFHHPEKFGKTKQDIERQMCDEFWEVGASGNVYTKQDVIETLCDRYNDSNYQYIWEANDFSLAKISPDNYLLTYVLIQDKTRVTRRSTLWRRINGDWKTLYHQGTIIKELNHV